MGAGVSGSCKFSSKSVSDSCSSSICLLPLINLAMPTRGLMTFAMKNDSFCVVILAKSSCIDSDSTSFMTSFSSHDSNDVNEDYIVISTGPLS